MRFVKRQINGYALIVALIVVFTAIFIFFNTDEPLQPYTESAASATESENSKEISMTTYTNETPLFTVSVPSDWTKVTQNGYPTWICKEYSSSFQIQTFSSSAELLDITGETIKGEIESLGGEIVDFRWIDEWNYTVSYRMFQKSGTTAHIEVTAFNTKDAIRFVFIITETHYDKLESTVAAIIDSFVWNRFSDGQSSGGS